MKKTNKQIIKGKMHTYKMPGSDGEVSQDITENSITSLIPLPLLVFLHTFLHTQ